MKVYFHLSSGTIKPNKMTIGLIKIPRSFVCFLFRSLRLTVWCALVSFGIINPYFFEGGGGGGGKWRQSILLGRHWCYSISSRTGLSSSGFIRMGKQQWFTRCFHATRSSMEAEGFCILVNMRLLSPRLHQA